WRLPLDPHRAQALTALLDAVPYEVVVSDALRRALERRRARRPRDELLVDLSRPDQDWWFSFPTDVASDLVDSLLEHPGAVRAPAIERGLVPLDLVAAEILRACLERDPRLRLTEDAHHALTELVRGGPRHPASPVETLAWEVELRRDRRGRTWILIGAEHAPG